MDSVKYWDVVRQRKMSYAATEKGGMSKVSAGLCWWLEKICEIYNIT